MCGESFSENVFPMNCSLTRNLSWHLPPDAFEKYNASMSRAKRQFKRPSQNGPRIEAKMIRSIASIGRAGNRSLVLYSVGWIVLRAGTRQLQVLCYTLVDSVGLSKTLEFGPTRVCKTEWDSEKKRAYFRERQIRKGRKIKKIPTRASDACVTPGRILESMEPEKGKWSYWPIEIGERALQNAPAVFRRRLKRLHENGLLKDPAFRRAFLNAFTRAVKSRHLSAQSRRTCSETPPEIESERWWISEEIEDHSAGRIDGRKE